jgi:hypothetical protein
MLLLESHRTVTYRRALIAATKWAKALTQGYEEIAALANAMRALTEKTLILVRQSDLNNRRKNV